MVTDISTAALVIMANQSTSSGAKVLLPISVGEPIWWMPLFWGVTGVSFCVIELFVRKYFGHKYQAIALIMGMSALVMVLGFSKALMVVQFKWQVLYWMGLSTVSAIWLRPMFLKSKREIAVPDATEAKTLSAILPGEVGRVLYEGSSWPAQCDDRDLAIGANQKVYVLRCEGNTLIVVPDQLFHS